MVLAPQLRQSLKILQVPSLELRSAILEELQANPTLEELPSGDLSLDAEAAREEPADGESSGEGEDGDRGSEDMERGPDADWGESKPDYESAERLDFQDDFSVLERMGEDWSSYMEEEAGELPYTTEDAERRQHFFDSLTPSQSFQEALFEQARSVEEDREVLEALEYVLGSMDDNGILTSKPSDMALMSEKPFPVIQKAVDLLRSLEPAGLGATSVKECLLLQLERAGKGKSLAAKILQKKWDLLLRRRIPEIARAFRVSPSEVETAIGEIAQLDPAPARRFMEDNNQTVEPDVVVEKDESGEWQVVMNNDYVPRLRINPEYKRMLAMGKVRGQDREYLRRQFRSGRFMISAIEQRQMTIEKIARQLLDFQRGFFEEGPSKLQPLTMSTVAERVGVHETTVSRAVAGKYVRTPHGLYEMKYFFTPGYQGEDGHAVSNKSIKDRIARIIEEEPSAKPYSDQKIVGMLKEEGIKIARRTVAKYREELGILPTNLRRQYG